MMKVRGAVRTLETFQLLKGGKARTKSANAGVDIWRGQVRCRFDPSQGRASPIPDHFRTESSLMCGMECRNSGQEITKLKDCPCAGLPSSQSMPKVPQSLLKVPLKRT